jgi:hypothetical protein
VKPIVRRTRLREKAVDNQGKSITEVWAQLILSGGDSHRVREFLMRECGIKASRIVGNMHLTVYYARRPMPGVVPSTEAASVVVPATETRFMVMAPGGENPRPELEPSRRTVGIRIHRRSGAMPAIIGYRERLLAYETTSVLGKRPPSDRRRNAFGARHFQPHVAVLRPGSGVARDLTKLGALFRTRVGELRFDRFVVDVVTRRPR